MTKLILSGPSRLSIIIASATLCMGSISQAQTIATSANVEGSVSWVKETDHPWAFGRCWGSPSETSPGSGKANASSVENGGRLHLSVGVDGRAVQAVKPLELDWSSSYGEDQVFRVNMSRSVNTALPHDSHSDACTTYNWKYKLESLDSTFKTTLSFKVPSNVWLVKLKYPKGKPPAGFKISARNVNSAPLALASKFPMIWDAKLDVSSDIYIVVPADGEVSLTIESKSSAIQSSNSNVEIEITMVGANRCEIGKSYYGMLSKESISKASSDLQSDELSAQRALEYLICASSGEEVRHLLYGEKVNVLIDLMQALDEARSRVSTANSYVSSMTLAASLASVDSALFSVAYNVAENMIRYCSSIKVLDLATGQYSYTEKIHRRAQLVFDKVRHHLSFAVPGYLAALSSELEPWSQQKKQYSDLTDDESTRRILDTLFRNYHADNRSFVVDQISMWMGDLPEDALTAPFRKKMNEDLKRLKEVQIALISEVVTQLRGFYNKLPLPVDSAKLASRVPEAQGLVKNIQLNVDRIEAAYGNGGFSDAFIDAVVNITTAFYSPTQERLAQKAGGIILSTIQNSSDTKTDSPELLKGLKQCVRID